VRIETVKGNLLLDYAVTSHVWIYGLGNENNNALPECHLVCLMEVVKKLPEVRMRSYKIQSGLDMIGENITDIFYNGLSCLTSS
jgi:hypothetical protein